MLNEKGGLMANHGVTDTGKVRIINRLRRIEGQARGIQRMVTEGEDCVAIITQLAALQAAVKAVSKVVLSNYLERCIEEELTKSGDLRGAVQRATDILLQIKL